MEEFIPANEIFDNSGTNNLPLNCAWVGGLKKVLRKLDYFTRF